MSNQLVILQSADTVPGSWTDIMYRHGVSNTVTLSVPATNQQRFFRVKTVTFQPLALKPDAPTLTGGAVSLPDAAVGVPYAQQFIADFTGVPPYSFQVTETLPAGLGLTVLSNETPNASVRLSSDGSANLAGQRHQFTISVVDGDGTTVSRIYDVRVVAPPPAIVTQSLALKAGQQFNGALTGTNGEGALSWSVVSGPVPEGVSVLADGTVEGMPAAAAAEFGETGRHVAVLRVSDSFTDRLTGAPAPRSATNTVVQMVKLSYNQNIWSARPSGPSLGSICTLCHGSGFPPDFANAASIIGIASQPGPCGDRVYIEPGDPNASLILQKLRGPDCGNRMPLGGPFFDATKMGRLERWIRELTPGGAD